MSARPTSPRDLVGESTRDQPGIADRDIDALLDFEHAAPAAAGAPGTSTSRRCSSRRATSTPRRRVGRNKATGTDVKRSFGSPEVVPLLSVTGAAPAYDSPSAHAAEQPERAAASWPRNAAASQAADEAQRGDPARGPRVRSRAMRRRWRSRSRKHGERAERDRADDAASRVTRAGHPVRARRGRACPPPFT